MKTHDIEIQYGNWQPNKTYFSVPVKITGIKVQVVFEDGKQGEIIVDQIDGVRENDGGFSITTSNDPFDAHFVFNLELRCEKANAVFNIEC